MSAISELREQKEEHENLRAAFTPEQNKELDELYQSGSSWHMVKIAAIVALCGGLFALAIM